MYGADKRLTPQGRALAQQVGASLDRHYDFAIVSPKTRCRETMEAFGIADYSEDASFGRLDRTALAPHADEVRQISRLRAVPTLSACFSVQATREILREEGKRFLDALAHIASELPQEGRALIVSHGGSIETAALQKASTFHVDEIGGPLNCCEGIIFEFNDNTLKSVKVLRHATAVVE